MFDDVLIESAGKDKKKGGWVTALISAVLHILIIGAVVAAGYYVKKNPEVIEKPIQAFITSAPPPPPPPPPAASSASSTPRPHPVETPTPQPTFRQPREVPREVPQTAETDTAPETGGVVGGQKGGVVGGVVGGQIGGVIGGTLGGQVGGQLGGTGTALRVGGDVTPPNAIRKLPEPQYTDVARKVRLQGMVILEAIIDRNGDVTDVRILKPLGMGLDNSALEGVKRWKFQPGTLHGQPVPVIYNLTVIFRLQ